MTDLKTYYASAAVIYKFWLENGFSPAQAAGLLAQADAESSLNPAAIGDHDQAFGLDQWHTARVAAIKAGCGVDLHAKPIPPLADQLKAALWELRNPEKGALAHILAARTAAQAGAAACQFWERPADHAQYAKRGVKAEGWAVHFSKNPVA